MQASGVRLFATSHFQVSHSRTCSALLGFLHETPKEWDRLTRACMVGRSSRTARFFNSPPLVTRNPPPRPITGTTLAPCQQ
jgi:hypothetical protein